MTDRTTNHNETECEAIRSRLALVALGDGVVEQELHEHMQLCPPCADAFHDYLGVANLLQHEPGQLVTPPVALRSRLVAAVGREQAPKQKLAQQPPVRRWRLVRWAAMAGALALLLALLGWNLTLQGQLTAQNSQLANSRTGWQTLVAMMNDPDVRVSRMTTGTVDGSFWGVPDQRVACLMIEDLPLLESGQFYQIWVSTGSGWIPVDSYQPRSTSVWFLLDTDGPLNRYQAVLVTVESSSSSASPSLPAVLEGPIFPRQG